MRQAFDQQLSDRIDVENIRNIAAEIQRRKESRRDLICPAAKLQMTTEGRLILGGLDTFSAGEDVFTSYADAEAAAENHKRAKGEYLPIKPLGRSGAMPVSDTAEQQLCQRLGLPRDYVKRLRKPAEDGTNNADLAAFNFTTLLDRTAEKFLVRTLDGKVRAILSNTYKVMDNADLFFAAADSIQRSGAVVWKARLWDDGFEMFAAAPEVSGIVQRDVDARRQAVGDGASLSAADGAMGSHFSFGGFDHKRMPDGKDWHYAACRISNSETGRGGLSVKRCILRGVCVNTLVLAQVVRTVHLGRRNDVDGLVRHLGADTLLGQDGGEIYAQDTQAAEGKAIWLKLRDVVATTFKPEPFQAEIDKLNRTAARKIVGDAEKAVGNVVSEYELTEERKALILANLLGSGDMTQFGLVQAVTQTAHYLDAKGQGAEASEMEGVGGHIAARGEKAFAELVGA